MDLLAQLASSLGHRAEAANRAAAALCRQRPALLADIAAGLASDDAALAGDCAEVMTMVAESDPDLVAPFAPRLASLLAHTASRPRWEAMHALALVAALKPRLIARLLPTLEGLLRRDPSVIVRDYAVEAIAVYAGAGPAAAERAFAPLRAALALWDGKHAARALRGLAHVAARAPHRAPEVRALAYTHLGAGRGVTRQAARALLRAMERR
jgi:hypothetical protein